MSECPLCGGKATRRAEVEGVILDVCANCVKMGKEIAKVELREKKKYVPKVPEEMEIVVREDLSKIIKGEREKRKLTQEQLALKLKERHSTIRRVEEGWNPSMDVIKKLERFFGMILTESVPGYKGEKKGSEKITIGDIIEVS